MRDLVEVGCGMAILGRITAAYLAALQAHTQVNPGVSDLETLLTTLGMRLHLLHMIFYVGTLCCAHAILSCSIRCVSDIRIIVQCCVSGVTSVPSPRLPLA